MLFKTLRMSMLLAQDPGLGSEGVFEICLGFFNATVLSSWRWIDASGGATDLAKTCGHATVRREVWPSASEAMLKSTPRASCLMNHRLALGLIRNASWI